MNLQDVLSGAHYAVEARRILSNHYRIDKVSMGKELFKIRKWSGVSQERVASRICVSAKLISRFERGLSLITEGILTDFLKACDELSRDDEPT